jgi:hypothetical protein
VEKIPAHGFEAPFRLGKLLPDLFDHFLVGLVIDKTDGSQGGYIRPELPIRDTGLLVADDDFYT